MSSAIALHSVVTLDIELCDAQDALLRREQALSYLHGSPGGLFDALEAALEGKQPGDTVRVQLEPEQAFGEYDARLLRMEPQERYGDGLRVGMEIEDGFDDGELRRYTVTDLAAGKVVLDGNHPLAGMALRFTCRVLAVRPCTARELETGTVEAQVGVGSGEASRSLH